MPELQCTHITIMITFWYQFIDRGWIALQSICLVVSVVTLIYFIAFLDESPKFLYAYEQWDDSRNLLKTVARTNGLSERQV